MAVSTRIESIDRDIELILAEDLSPMAVSAAIADAARLAINEAEDINTRALGRTPVKRVYVDGRLGAALETVSPRGTILAEFDLMEDSIRWIGQQLVQHSPVLTGAYARTHFLLVDGVEIDPETPIPATFDEIVFINAQPYARKIERGLSDQAPDGVYEGVAAIAAKRLGAFAKVRFGYRSANFGGVSQWAGGTKAKTREKGVKRTDRLTRQPAIIITRHR